MSDPAHKDTERLLKEIEKEIAEQYRIAEKEVSETLADYMKKFEAKDKIWQRWVKEGQKTQKEYKEWRVGQIAMGQRWAELRQNLAENYHNSNKIAKSIVNGHMPEVYAINHDYATFEVEHDSLVDTGYTLYDRMTFEELVKTDQDILPPPGKRVSERIAEGKDIRWNNKIIQSAMMQALLQGESIPKIATRLAEAVGDSNRKAAIRNARTMTTGVQNAGRVAGFKRAKGLGIDMTEMWLAQLDNRTRHEHRMLDGQTVDVGEPFEVDGYQIRFPGDPEAPGHLVFNCRCTLRGQLKGFEVDPRDMGLRNDSKLGDMTYDEWREAKAKPEKITKQDEISEKMRRAYGSEYRR